MSNDKMRGLQEGAQMTFEEAEALKRRLREKEMQKNEVSSSGLIPNMGTDLAKYEAAQRKIQEIIDRDGGQPMLEPQPELRPPMDIENDPYAREIPMPDPMIQKRALNRLRQQ